MIIEIKVPNLPESVTDATVAKWHKKPGDAVARDETLLELETEKVMLEVPATQAGVLDKILKPEGSVVTASETLGILKAEGVGAAAKPAEKQPAAAPTAAAATPTPTAAPQASTQASAYDDLGPAVRRMITEQGIDV